MEAANAEFILNPGRNTGAFPARAEPAGSALAFHRSVPGYRPSPLRDLPELAAQLGIAELTVKHEADRFGLPAYKALGAFWAAWQALTPLAGSAVTDADPDLQRLAEALEQRPGITLLAATDGNHGHAVARIAHLLGVQARIFVPEDMSAARQTAIASEGAAVVTVAGSYDDAVAAAAAARSESSVLLQDTAWPGYEAVPRFIVDGYSTIFSEIDTQLAEAGREQPTLVLVPIGVGSLAAAAALHYRAPDRAEQPHLVGVEPTAAACMLESLKHGELTTVPGPHSSSMAGLNCGAPSSAAWPLVEAGFDALVAIPDARALEAVQVLAGAGVGTAESGAAAVGGLLELLAHPETGTGLRLGPDTRVLALVTEGVMGRAA